MMLVTSFFVSMVLSRQLDQDNAECFPIALFTFLFVSLLLIFQLDAIVMWFSERDLFFVVDFSESVLPGFAFAAGLRL
jgi:hypothetical protein